MKLQFENPKVPSRSISYEAHCPGREYTANGTRLACRVVLNGVPHLYIWNKGYKTPSPLDKSSNGQVPMALVIDAFRKLGKISGDVTIEQSKEAATEPVESEEMKALKKQVEMMQKQMELMASNMVQQAQMTQSIINMNSISMNMNNMKTEPVDIGLQQEDMIQFNFNAVEEAEEEVFFDEISEEVAMTAIEEIEEIRVVEQPKRRASNRE